MQPEIRYVELKTDGLRGHGRIMRVSFSKTGKTIYCDGRTLLPLKGFALKANYHDEKTYEEFWVSSPRRDGHDSLFPATVDVDDEVRQEYWTEVRGEPNNITKSSYKSPGKTKREQEALEKAVRRHDIDRRFRAP